MPQSAYLHEGLEFPEFIEAGEDHGFGWLDRRALWRRATLLQSVGLSLCVHLAVFAIFVFTPGSSEKMSSPWLEVQLVSLGSDGNEAPAGAGQEGRPGGSPAVSGAEPESARFAELVPPEPVAPVVEELPKEEPEPMVNPVAARPRPLVKQKQPAQLPQPQPKTNASETCSAVGTESPDPTPSSAKGDGLVPAAPGEGEPGAGGGTLGKAHGGHGGGPVDAEFGAANGPRFAHKCMPHYPRLARQLGKEATVVLRVTIDEKGRPIAVEALKSAGSGFDEEAVKAVKESRFHPAKREGRPVICRAILPIRFQLKSSE